MESLPVEMESLPVELSGADKLHQKPSESIQGLTQDLKLRTQVRGIRGKSVEREDHLSIPT